MYTRYLLWWRKKTRVRRTFLWLVVVILTLSIIAWEIPEMSLASGCSKHQHQV
jgi:hypothetical protein